MQYSLRSSIADGIFRLLNFIDTQWFMLILILLVSTLCHWKWGARLFYIMCLSGLLNHLLKMAFELPRPFHLNDSLGVIQVSSYGFPSGAAQSAVLLSGILIREWKSKWRWMAGINFFFWLSFSRVYLGVHFFTDLLGGWCIGFFLLWVFYSIRPKLELYLERQSFLYVLMISQIIPLMMLLLYPSEHMIKLMCAAMGVGLGLWSKIYSIKNKRIPKSGSF